MPTLSALACLTLAAACTDDGITPRRVVGLYQLVAVDGQPLPAFRAPSVGGGLITHEDLLLEPGGTFLWGFSDGGPLDGITSGRWHVAGRALRLRFDTGVELPGTTRGSDFAIERGGSTLEFRWIPTPAEWNRRYALVSVNGRTDLRYDDTWSDGVTSSTLTVADTIRVQDGIFFTRRRKESVVTRLANGDTVMGSSEWTAVGSVSGSGSARRDGSWELWDYGPGGSAYAPAVDTVMIEGNTLTRRVRMWDRATQEYFIWEERYIER